MSTTPEAIAAFIEARLADDERIAKVATQGPWGAAHGGTPRGSGVYVSKGPIIAEMRSSVDPFSYDAEHMARHDPIRVLRQADATRAVVAACLRTLESDDYGLHLADRVLRHLACAWANHADYRKEWEPLG